MKNFLILTILFTINLCFSQQTEKPIFDSAIGLNFGIDMDSVKMVIKNRNQKSTFSNEYTNKNLLDFIKSDSWLIMSSAMTLLNFFIFPLWYYNRYIYNMHDKNIIRFIGGGTDEDFNEKQLKSRKAEKYFKTWIGKMNRCIDKIS